jgi:hypothetical protein
MSKRTETTFALRDVLAGVGVAAVSFSLVHGARVMWNSYKERKNTALEEYPPHSLDVVCWSLLRVLCNVPLVIPQGFEVSL